MSRLIPRSVRSWAVANIILDNGLFDEWRVYCYHHQKIKSKYRLANLFLLNKGLLYKHVEKPISGLNMDNIEEYYYEE